MFVIPPTPIPFLGGSQITTFLPFNMHLKENNNSDVHVTQWNAWFHLVANSRVGLTLDGSNSKVHRSFNCHELFKDVASLKGNGTHLSIGSFLFSNYSFCTTPVPWERDICMSNTSKECISRLHDRFNIRIPYSVLSMFFHQGVGRKAHQSTKNIFTW